MRYIRLLLIMSSIVLGGCSVFSPVRTGPQHSYVINSVPCHVVRSRTQDGSILVTTPNAPVIYATTDMAYTTYAHQIAYFSKSGWADTPAQMLQPLIVQTLQKTHHFHAVGLGPSIGYYDYILNTQLSELIQDFRCNPSLLRMKMRAQIIRFGTGEIVATKDFSVIVPSPQNAPYGGVLAANRATAEILQQIAAFCVRNAR